MGFFTICPISIEARLRVLSLLQALSTSLYIEFTAQIVCIGWGKQREWGNGEVLCETVGRKEGHGDGTVIPVCTGDDNKRGREE